ncbi:MAG: transporter [Ignavibacteria bacterium]
MKILLFTAIVCFMMNFQLLYSQVEDISTDRPDQSESPLLVPKGYFQMEAGFVSENDKPSPGVKHNVLSAPSLLFRYGLSKNVELRAGIELISNSVTVNTSVSQTGFGPFSAGTKIKLFTEKGSMPEASFLFSVSIPFKKNSAFQSEYIGSEFRLLMTNTLSKRFSLSYNLGGEWGAGSPGATGIYTLSLGAVVAKKLSAFAELYGFLPEKSSPDHRFDAGLTYLIMKNIQADVSAGAGISENSPDFFIGFGISLRIPK